MDRIQISARCLPILVQVQIDMTQRQAIKNCNMITRLNRSRIQIVAIQVDAIGVFSHSLLHAGGIEQRKYISVAVLKPIRMLQQFSCRPASRRLIAMNAG